MFSLPEFARRTLGALLLAVYVLVAAGVPLPTGGDATNGELYPCASSGCGCKSAESCWRSCCCHTLAERLQWAAKHGVKPPEFALVAAKAAGLNVSGERLAPKVVRAQLALTQPAAKSCCKSKRTCCSSHDKSCCESQSLVTTDKTKADDKNATDFIVVWRALGCQGQSLQWLAAVPSLITVEHEFSAHLPLAAWLGPHTSEAASPLYDTPTPPPPERA